MWRAKVFADPDDGNCSGALLRRLGRRRPADVLRQAKQLISDELGCAFDRAGLQSQDVVEIR